MTIIGQFQNTIVNISAWYLRQKNLARLLEAVGLILDGSVDGMRAGMRLSYPLRCPANQLPVILKDRALPIYPTEPTAGTRERARHWWQLHRARGSHQGELRHLQYYFTGGVLPVIRIVHQSGDGATATWHTLDADGNYSVHVVTPSNFYFDSSPDQWSRFWVILYPPAGYSRTLWDAGWLWDDGTLWDGGALGFTAAQLADMVQMALDWHAAHSALWGFILCWDPTKLNPTETAGVQDADGWWNLPDAGQWGVLKNIGGTATRPPYIDFVYDRSQ